MRTTVAIAAAAVALGACLPPPALEELPATLPLCTLDSLPTGLSNTTATIGKLVNGVFQPLAANAEVEVYVNSEEFPAWVYFVAVRVRAPAVTSAVCSTAGTLTPDGAGNLVGGMVPFDAGAWTAAWGTGVATDLSIDVRATSPSGAPLIALAKLGVKLVNREGWLGTGP